MARNDWRKSSRSGSTGNCLEARVNGGKFQVRDSKLGSDSPILGLSPAEFSTLLRYAK